MRVTSVCMFGIVSIRTNHSGRMLTALKIVARFCVCVFAPYDYRHSSGIRQPSLIEDVNDCFIYDHNPPPHKCAHNVSIVQPF